MLDTVGPELQVHNNTGKPIELKADDHVTITSDVTIEPSAKVLPVSYAGLSQVLPLTLSNSSYVCDIRRGTDFVYLNFNLMILNFLCRM